jgi:very-short-patch-repair endonuclease
VLDDHVPFSRAEARASGISDRRLKGSEFRRIVFGYYLPSEVTPQPIHAIRAALQCHPEGAVATHFSAARLRGAPVPDHPEVHVTVRDAADRRRRRGLRCHALAIDEADVQTLAGVRISSPCRMFVELARYLNLVELVVLGDWMVQTRLTSVPSLRSYSRRSMEQYADRAARAASYVRLGSESPRESRLRLLLMLAGLPTMHPNPTVVIEDRTFRVDLAFLRARVAVEYDGVWHDDEDQPEIDQERRSLLERDGWIVIVVRKDELYTDPGAVIARVVAALRQRGVRVGLLSDDWRAHFAR